MVFPDQSDNVVMDSLARGNKVRPVAVYCDFLEVWDTEKASLCNCSLGLGCPFCISGNCLSGGKE